MLDRLCWCALTLTLNRTLTLTLNVTLTLTLTLTLPRRAPSEPSRRRAWCARAYISLYLPISPISPYISLYLPRLVWSRLSTAVRVSHSGQGQPTAVRVSQP